MLDIKFIRESPDIVKKDLKKRNDNEKLQWLEDLLKKDNEWRDLKQKIDQLRNKRNTISEEINTLKKQGKHKEAELKIKEASRIPEEIKASEEKLIQLKEKIDFYLMRLPNILHQSVPIGKDAEDNKVVRKVGKIKKFNFELKSHGDLIEDLGLADFKRAANVSGTGFYYLIGKLALLDLALKRFAIDYLVKKKYTLIEPPLMLNKKAYEGVTDLADFEKVMYKIDNEDLYLIATSEHPMAALYMNEIFNENQLPIRFAGISSCFRKEIGSHGVDTRGLFRVHQFDKIEQFVFCKPEESWKIHEELLTNAEYLFKKLGLPYRVVNICSGDIGLVAAKKYDIEVWMPRQNKYAEVVSCSNCTGYQAARLNIKYKKGEEKEYVHTLNSTAIATSRALVAIIENFQEKDGSIKIPKVLVPYLGFSKIEAKEF